MIWKFCIFGFLFVLCQNVWLQETDNRLILVHADIARGRPDADESIRELIGNVKFRQGDAFLICERAIQFVETGKSILQGDVFYQDSVKQLSGKQLTFYEKQDLFILNGNSQLADTSKILSAHTIEYYRSSDKAKARGQVLLADTVSNMQIRCSAADYEQQRGYALCTGDPVFTRADTSDKDTTTIRGIRFEMFSDGDTLLITGRVQIDRGAMTAFCDTVEYFQKREIIVLRPEPKVWQEQDYLTGKIIKLYLRDSEIYKVDIIEDAVAVTQVDSTIRTQIPYDLLTGGDMQVFITDESIDSIIVRQQATSYYHVIDEGRENGLNKALGDLLKISFSENELDKVHLYSDPGVSNGEFYPQRIQNTLEKEILEQLRQHRFLDN